MSNSDPNFGKFRGTIVGSSVGFVVGTSLGAYLSRSNDYDFKAPLLSAFGGMLGTAAIGTSLTLGSYCLAYIPNAPNFVIGIPWVIGIATLIAAPFLTSLVMNSFKKRKHQSKPMAFIETEKIAISFETPTIAKRFRQEVKKSELLIIPIKLSVDF